MYFNSDHCLDMHIGMTNRHRKEQMVSGVILEPSDSTAQSWYQRCQQWNAFFLDYIQSVIQLAPTEQVHEARHGSAALHRGPLM